MKQSRLERIEFIAAQPKHMPVKIAPMDTRPALGAGSARGPGLQVDAANECRRMLSSIGFDLGRVSETPNPYIP